MDFEAEIVSIGNSFEESGTIKHDSWKTTSGIAWKHQHCCLDAMASENNSAIREREQGIVDYGFGLSDAAGTNGRLPSRLDQSIFSSVSPRLQLHDVPSR